MLNLTDLCPIERQVGCLEANCMIQLIPCVSAAALRPDERKVGLPLSLGLKLEDSIRRCGSIAVGRTDSHDLTSEDAG